MKRTKKKKPITAEAIARMADQGKDISRFFAGRRIMDPIQIVNVDFTAEMLEELDHEAAALNISRQGVIKTLVREGLDSRHPRTTNRGNTGRRIRASRSRRTVTG